MRGKYQRRRRARLEGESGAVIEAAPINTFIPRTHGKGMANAIRKVIDPGVTLGEIPSTRLQKAKAGEAKIVHTLQERNALEAHNVSKLREIATERGVAFTTRTRKADLIDLIVGSS